MKTCKTCGECKPLTMFYQREDGSYRPNCRVCQRTRNALRYMERLKEGHVRNRKKAAPEPLWTLPTHSIREGLDCVRLRKWRGPVNNEPMRARL